jgi:hypothetical protein
MSSKLAWMSALSFFFVASGAPVTPQDTTQRRQATGGQPAAQKLQAHGPIVRSFRELPIASSSPASANVATMAELDGGRAGELVAGNPVTLVPRSAGRGGPAKDGTTTQTISAASEGGWAISPDVGLGYRDPEIAVGYHHVVVTTTGALAIFDKNNGQPIGPVTSSSAFFSSLLPGINASLSLPGYQIDTVYALRVLFDEYRGRFWVGALARNSKARDSNMCAELSLRRSKVLVAVSESADPTGQWAMYWWDAIQDDGACKFSGSCSTSTRPCASTPNCPGVGPACPNSTYIPGQGADYPMIGISETWFMESNAAGSGTSVTVAPADDLAGVFGGSPPSPGKYDVWRVRAVFNDNTEATGSLQPAVHHGHVPGGHAFMVSARNGSSLVVWSLDSNNGIPELTEHDVPVACYLSTPLHLGAQQKASPPGVPVAARVDLGVIMGNQLMKAVYRNGHIYATWHDCVRWGSGRTCDSDEQSHCMTAIRLASVDVRDLSGSLSADIDRTFGGSNNSDPVGTVFSYGWPTLEVGKSGAIVLGYNRSGSTIFPESRYSVYYPNQLDIDPSHLSHAGQYTLTESAANDDGSVGRLDVTGAALDPSDDASVWMAQAYSAKVSNTDGGWNLFVRWVNPRDLHRDPLPDPPVTSGNWASIRTGHRLVYLGGHDRVLDWEPATGHYRIWNFDRSITKGDPLPGPAVVEGTWSTVRTGHELLFLSALNQLLDWEPGTGHWRLWRYDSNAGGASDPFPAPPTLEGTDPLGMLFAPGRNVLEISGKLLTWDPSNGSFRLVKYNHQGSSVDLFSGTAVIGAWQSVRTGHRLIDLGLSGSADEPRVLDWEPSTGGYRIWRYDDGAVSTNTDPLPSPPLISGKWLSIVTGHELLYLGGDRVLDWTPQTGDFRLFNYVRQ